MTQPEQRKTCCQQVGDWWRPPSGATIEQCRECTAKNLSDWYAGKTEEHPFGISGLRYILPQELTQNCWDTHPRGWKSSAWGNAAGMIEDTPKRKTLKGKSK